MLFWPSSRSASPAANPTVAGHAAPEALTPLSAQWGLYEPRAKGARWRGVSAGTHTSSMSSKLPHGTFGASVVLRINELPRPRPHTLHENKAENAVVVCRRSAFSAGG